MEHPLASLYSEPLAKTFELPPAHCGSPGRGMVGSRGPAHGRCVGRDAAGAEGLEQVHSVWPTSDSCGLNGEVHGFLGTWGPL